MIALYNAIFYTPLVNLLIFFYTAIPGKDMGVAILLLTVVVKLILLLPSAQMLRSQKALQTIQPEIDALKKKYGKDKEGMAKELMALYKRERVNPLSSCFPLLIQIPFLIAVYQAFRVGLSTNGVADLLYPFVHDPGVITTTTLFGLVDLAKTSTILAFLAGVSQFFQTKMLSTKRPPMNVPGSKDENLTSIMNKQMLYMMPAMTFFISLSLPAGLALYWFLTTVLTIAQQLFIFKKKTPLSSPHVSHL